MSSWDINYVSMLMRRRLRGAGHGDDRLLGDIRAPEGEAIFDVQGRLPGGLPREDDPPMVEQAGGGD